VELRLPLSGGPSDVIERTYFLDERFRTLNLRFEEPLISLYRRLLQEGVLKRDLGVEETTGLRALERISPKV